MRDHLEKIIKILHICTILVLFIPQTVTSLEGIPPRPHYPQGIKEYAQQRVGEVFGHEHWESFEWILEKESNWNHTAQNPTSSAYGLCQTMMSLYEDDLDDDFRVNPYIQVDWCIWYTQERYSNPIKAKAFWVENRWW